MKKNLLKTLSVLAFLISFETVANAVEITFSDKSKNSSPVLKFNVASPLPMNFGFNGKIEFSPSYSNLVGPLKFGKDERWGFMGNAEANLSYNWTLLNAKTILGDFNPTISPYVGYKQYASQYGYGGLSLENGVDLKNIVPVTGLSTIGGINYGLRFSTSLPLGFFAFAEGGMTTLLGNGLWWEKGPDRDGKFTGNSMTLPRFEVGANFNLLNLFILRAGYHYYFLPDVRTNESFISADSKANIQAIDLGATFLFFSI
ncbi:MAG: hypothetical protein U0457_12090 [Candidatus Sericytochromatia bacterium]